MKNQALLIIGASLADAQAAEVLSSIMLNLLVNRLYTRFTPGCPYADQPVFFILDEAPRLKERVCFEEVLAISRDAKAGFCLALQDPAQLGDDHTVAAILSNCHTLILLRGASPSAAKYFASRLGQRIESAIIHSRQRGPFDLFATRSISRHPVPIPVLQDKEIMYPPFGPYSALALVGTTHKPVLLDLTRF